MATEITIKRYNGSGWVEYAPKTTISQVENLQSTLNGKQPLLSFDNTPTKNSDNPVTSGGIFNAIEVAKKSAAYVTEAIAVGYDLYLAFTNDISGLEVGDNFPNDNSVHLIEIHNLINGADYNYLLTKLNNTLAAILYIGTGDAPEGSTKLRIGNNIYITNLEVPDLWFGEEKDFYGAIFYPLETEHPDVSSYITSVSYDTNMHVIKYSKSSGDTNVVDLDDFASMTDAGAITIGGVTKTPIYSHQSLDDYSTKANTVSNVSYSSGKIQKTINGTTSDVLTVKIDNGTITIGSTSITPLTSHQTMYYRPISVGGTTKLANTSSSALNFVNEGNVTFTYDNGLKASVDLSSYAPKASPTFSGTVTMPFANAGFVKTNSSGVLSVDTTSYTPTSRTINGLDLSANRTLYAETVYANKTVIGPGTTAPTLASGRTYYDGDLWFVTSS